MAGGLGLGAWTSLIELPKRKQATMSSDEESVGSNASEEEITDLSNR